MKDKLYTFKGNEDLGPWNFLQTILHDFDIHGYTVLEEISSDIYVLQVRSVITKSEIRKPF